MDLKEKNKAIGILKKVYHHTNSDYETDYGDIVGYKTDFITENQWEILNRNNLTPNKIETYTHDSLVSEFLKLKTNKKLTFEFSKSLFLKGLTGEFPRYRQTLISYLYLQDIKKHNYTSSKEYSGCTICCLPEKTTEDITHNLFTYYLGHSWNESPKDFVSELEDILQYQKPEINDNDKQNLIKLLVSINNASENETPGQLEKRIGKEKLLPKTDKYKRYGILQTLAILEILPSRKELDNQPSRSDIVLPLAGWKGKLGVNFEKAEEIFEITMPNNV
ncbi:hypothetical protein [Tenacibaculum dicentrarchi]|uniref:hypothetical protein n=1 Tax=Tenacibaculum dicentrarchi TaxID=669041 RepID=UPI00351929CC